MYADILKTKQEEITGHTVYQPVSVEEEKNRNKSTLLFY